MDHRGGENPKALTFEHNRLAKALENEAFYSHIITLKNGKESEKVILKDIQRHAYKPRILHVDFQRVRADEKLYMNIPLHFVGADKAPGVKEGGLISHIMTEVEISCLPADLPEYLEVDLSELKLNQILHLSDLPVPKGVEIVALAQENDQPIVSIHVPRAEVETPIPTEAPAPSEVPATAQKGEPEGEEKKQ